jgi:hypothetical protein
MVLVLGMLSIPVNCALAIGPHSLFIPAEAIAAQQHAAHAHHLDVIVPDLGFADRVCDPRLEVGPGNQGPVADSLPTPATALTVLVAVTSDDVIAQLPFMDAVLPTEQAAPSACHARLDVPPPRSGLSTP